MNSSFLKEHVFQPIFAEQQLACSQHRLLKYISLPKYNQVASFLKKINRSLRSRAVAQNLLVMSKAVELSHLPV